MPDPQYAPTATLLGDAEGLVALAERRGREERAVLGQVPRGGRAAGARDVPRDRVDRLGLAAEALGRAGVQQNAVGGRPRGAVGVEDRHAAAGQLDVARRSGTTSPVSSSPPARTQAARPPSRMRTSAHAAPAQQPPGTRRRGAAGVVVDHDAVAVAQPPAARRALQLAQPWQGMTTLLGRVVPGELGLEVDEHRARQVAREVLVASGRSAELPADVEQVRARRQRVRRTRGRSRLDPGRHELARDGLARRQPEVDAGRRLALVGRPGRCRARRAR